MALRILHCIRNLWGGGAERQLTILANQLDGHRVKFGIYCVDDTENHIDNPNCQILRLRDIRKHPWGMIKEMGVVLEKYQPDVVHCWLPPAVTVPSFIAAKLRGIPTVASFRNKLFFDKWFRVPEYLSIATCANTIVSNCNPDISNYLYSRLFYSKGGVVISNAVSVDKKFRRKNFLNQSNHGDDQITFLFVGRLTKQKNWKVLLEGLAKIKIRQGWELLVCGRGEDEDAFKALSVDLGINHRVKMLGFREDVYSIMANSDLLILPSWHEGMPNVVLEAMSIGLPSVVSNIPAHISLFNENAGVVFF